MKTLPPISATPEQLPIISSNDLGVEIICGAAGSGKTSTAVLRLKSLFFMFAARRQREQSTHPVRALLLTFNRTLAGYVRALAQHQISPTHNVELEITTFGNWAMSALDHPPVQEHSARMRMNHLANELKALTPEYVMKEVEYLLGRFHPTRLDEYLTAERTGRGPTPRVDRTLRRRILNNVVAPYHAWLDQQKKLDWNRVAVAMGQVPSQRYDVVIVDESQDLSANQLRAIQHHLAPEHAITFVIDTAQRIYARGFTWKEAGFEVRPGRSHVLRANHRNTREIAQFAAGLLRGISIDDDGALPNLTAATTTGPIPLVIRGLYQQQARWAIDYLRANIDMKSDSVAFLKPKGGNWFFTIKSHLSRHNIPFADITRESDWPEGPTNVATSTFYSAKGLEFDHVFILGLNAENTPYPDEDVDDQVFVLRRLLAVAVARSKQTVVIGYKPGAQSRLVDYFAPGTYREIDL